MFKLLIFLLIVLGIVGIATGALQIRVDNEKLSKLPKTVQGFIGDQSVASNVQYYFTMWKRKAELAIAGSNEKKFDLDMKYVEIDTKNLKEALDATKNPSEIIMKSKLLTESIERAKQGLEDVSDEALTKVRDAWVKILAAADQELKRLPGVADEYKKFQEELSNIVASPSPQQTPTPVPLKF
jgi:hypothetical protein